MKTYKLELELTERELFSLFSAVYTQVDNCARSYREITSEDANVYAEWVVSELEDAMKLEEKFQDIYTKLKLEITEEYL